MTAPRGLSRPTTSFIGLSCQGIHRVPLQHTQKNTYKAKSKNKDARVHYTVLKQHTPHTITNHIHSQQPHMEQETTRHTQSEKCCSRHPTMHQHLLLSSVKHQTISFHALPSAATPPPLGGGVHPPKNNACSTQKNNKLLRKEVIQPHLPVRLPCYDLVPIADPTFDSSLHKG